ncbi:MAG: hypothetical protein Q7T63_20535 [Burkholderiaceae bacterium]|jgi:hypothetical protein|nr:hypothetical protein [Burkholderiaceae bacterium]
MKTFAALGIAGGFLFVVRGWIGLAVVLWVAARVTHQLAPVPPKLGHRLGQIHHQLPETSRELLGATARRQGE